MKPLVTINTLQSHTIKRDEGFWSVILPNTNRYIFNVIKTASGDYGTTIDLKAHKTFMSALAYLLPFFREAVEAQNSLLLTIERLSNEEEKPLVSKTKGLTQIIKTAVIAAAAAFATLPAVSMAENATDVNAAREAAAHADRMAEALNASLHDARYHQGISAKDGIEQQQADAAGAARAQAHSDLAAAESREAHVQTINDAVARADQRQAVADRYGTRAALSVQNSIQNLATHLDSNVTAQQQAVARSDAAVAAADARQASIDHYGTKGNPTLKAQYSQPQQKVSYSGNSQRPATLTNTDSHAAQVQAVNDAVARADQRQAVADRYGTRAALSVQNSIQNLATHLDSNVTAQQQAVARSDAAVAAVDARQASIDHYGTKGNPTLKAQYNPAQQNISYSGLSQRPGTSSINVGVTSLTPTTTVNVTKNGVTTTTTAASLAQIDPHAQVSVPMVSVFTSTNNNGGNQHSATSHTRGGSSNGGQNAASSHSAMAHGFGDNHVGGGSAQSGSRNVGHW